MEKWKCVPKYRRYKVHGRQYGHLAKILTSKELGFNFKGLEAQLGHFVGRWT
jgi:hypothetical protein